LAKWRKAKREMETRPRSLKKHTTKKKSERFPNFELSMLKGGTSKGGVREDDLLAQNGGDGQ